MGPFTLTGSYRLGVAVESPTISHRLARSNLKADTLGADRLRDRERARDRSQSAPVRVNLVSRIIK
uniref:SFRICE_014783 n=1 Tax=Spodoptera frugiperda TaxID=7108 RepID=A0A2H1WVF5_SPOFR